MKRDGTDTHHIVPVSIGGSDEEKNKLPKINRFRHGLYHSLFNNWHPSAIMRFFFEEILPFYFGKTITDLKLYDDFLKDFDIQMKELTDSALNAAKEDSENIKQITIDFHNRKKAEKFKLILQECLEIWGKEWQAHILFQKFILWFQNDSIRQNKALIQEIEEIEKELDKKSKGQ